MADNIQYLNELRLLGGLLVGGSSRRMGRPKATLTYGGLSMAEISAHALKPFVSESILLGSGQVAEALCDLQRLSDLPGLAGPMAGILAGLNWVPDAAWIVVSCDLPYLEEAAIEWLLVQRRLGCPAVMPRVGAGLEPLLAVYEPEARSLLENLAAEGCNAPRFIAESLGVLTPVPPAEIIRCWHNVNTPEEFAELV